MVNEGYCEVAKRTRPAVEDESIFSQFKTSLFKLRGHDIVLSPSKRVEELRNASEDELSFIKVNADIREFA